MPAIRPHLFTMLLCIIFSDGNLSSCERGLLPYESCPSPSFSTKHTLRTRAPSRSNHVLCNETVLRLATVDAEDTGFNDRNIKTQHEPLVLCFQQPQLRSSDRLVYTHEWQDGAIHLSQDQRSKRTTGVAANATARISGAYIPIVPIVSTGGIRIANHSTGRNNEWPAC